MLTISDIRAATVGGEFKLSAKLATDSGAKLSPVQNELFFSLPEEFKDFVHADRAECFLFAIIYFAMFRGEDVHLDATVSGQLVNVFNSDIIPLMAASKSSLKPVRVTVSNPKHFPGGGTMTGTGFSGGVDSFYTILESRRSALEPEEKVNVLFCFNVGTHGLADSEAQRAATEAKFRRRFKTFEPAAKKLGLPLIPINSNVHSFLPENILSAISVANSAAIYFVSAKLQRYLLASAGHNYVKLFEVYRLFGKYPLPSMESIEPMLLGLVSLPGLQISPSGTETLRINKCELLGDDPVAGEFLNVCNSVDVVEKNCGICTKCRRTMTELEIIGKLDNFHNAFDVKRYRREFKARDFAGILFPSENEHFANESRDYAAVHNIDLVKHTSSLDRFCARLNGTKVYQFLRRHNLLSAIKCLVGRGEKKK